jgi:hypothetical protein
MTEDIGTERNPYTDRSPITGRGFTNEQIIEAGEQFGNHERYLSLAPQTPSVDRRTHAHRADILWALVQVAKGRNDQGADGQ